MRGYGSRRAWSSTELSDVAPWRSEVQCWLIAKVVSSTGNKYINVRNHGRFNGTTWRRNVSAWSDQL